MLASQKWWFSVALLGAPVGVSKGLVGPRLLRSRGPINDLQPPEFRSLPELSCIQWQEYRERPQKTQCQLTKMYAISLQLKKMKNFGHVRWR